MHTIDTPTKKRFIKHLEALETLLTHSPYARVLTGFGNPKLEQLREDIEKLKQI